MWKAIFVPPSMVLGVLHNSKTGEILLFRDFATAERIIGEVVKEDSGEQEAERLLAILRRRYGVSAFALLAEHSLSAMLSKFKPHKTMVVFSLFFELMDDLRSHRAKGAAYAGPFCIARLRSAHGVRLRLLAQNSRTVASCPVRSLSIEDVVERWSVVYGFDADTKQALIRAAHLTQRR